MSNLASANSIVTWAEQQAEKPPPTESPSYKRLTDAERVAILQLHDRGWTQSAIAKHLNRSVSTIHETLQMFSPTVDLAKRKLKASALRMAENVVDHGDPRDHIQALKGLGVLQEQSASGLNVTINGVFLAGMGQALSPTSDVVESEGVSNPEQNSVGLISSLTLPADTP